MITLALDVLLGLLPGGIGAAVRRFANPQALVALAFGAMVVILVSVMMVVVHVGRRAAIHDAVVARDATWTARLATERLAMATARAALHKRSDDAAARARADRLADLQAGADYAADLERRIAELQDARRRAAAPADPVAIPKALAQELRR